MNVIKKRNRQMQRRLLRWKNGHPPKRVLNIIYDDLKNAKQPPDWLLEIMRSDDLQEKNAG